VSLLPVCGRRAQSNISNPFDRDHASASESDAVSLVEMPAENVSIISDNSLTCDYCHKQLKNKQSLSRHVKLHTHGQKNGIIKSKHEALKLTSSYSLADQKKDTQWVCFIHGCGAAFDTMLSLRAHRK